MPFAEEQFEIRTDYDVVTARQQARELARQMGFAITDQTRISTAVSEIARWALQHRGTVYFSSCQDAFHRGMECSCIVEIPLEQAAEVARIESFGARGLVDDYSVQVRQGDQVALIMRKWLR
jgi:serine/threonine-protein kinase RsbT